MMINKREKGDFGHSPIEKLTHSIPATLSCLPWVPSIPTKHNLDHFTLIVVIWEKFPKTDHESVTDDCPYEELPKKLKARSLAENRLPTVACGCDCKSLKKMAYILQTSRSLSVNSLPDIYTHMRGVNLPRAASSSTNYHLLIDDKASSSQKREDFMVEWMGV